MFKKNAVILKLFFCFLSLGLISCFEKKSCDNVGYYKDLKLINVNDEASFIDASIKGSIHLTYDELPKKVENWDKMSELVVYCTNYACTESDRVANKLIELGFSNVKVYKGGIQEWYQLSLKDSEAYPFEGRATQAFLHKSITKFDLKDSKIPVIDAVTLSSLLKSRKR